MDLLFFAHLLNGLLMVGLPLGLALYLTARFRPGWRIWLVGAGAFILSQAAHIPFNAFLLNPAVKSLAPLLSKTGAQALSAVLLGLSAGVFEEGLRWIAYRFWVKDARSWSRGLLLGAGHGGAEAIILGALVLVGFVNLVVMRHADLSTLVPANQLAAAQQQVAGYWGASWYDSLLGALERAFTIPCQIAMSLLVLQAFTRRRIYWLGLAVLYHTLLDGVIVYLMGVWNGQPWSVYAVEGVVGLFALASVALIFLLRRPEPPAPAEPALDLPPAPRTPIEVPATPEKLDDSRYL